MDATDSISRSFPKLADVGASKWFRALVTLARALLPDRPDGLLGYIVPGDEYNTLTGATSFTPAHPSQPGSEGFDEHVHRTWRKEQEALQILRRQCVESVPNEVIEGCPGFDPVYGALCVDPLVIVDHVRRRERTASALRYTEALEVLARPLAPGGNVEIYTSAQAAAHRVCEDMGFPLNQEEKLRRLADGVGGRSGPFGFLLELWEEQVHRK